MNEFVALDMRTKLYEYHRDHKIISLANSCDIVVITGRTIKRLSLSGILRQNDNLLIFDFTFYLVCIICN